MSAKREEVSPLSDSLVKFLSRAGASVIDHETQEGFAVERTPYETPVESRRLRVRITKLKKAPPLSDFLVDDAYQEQAVSCLGHETSECFAGERTSYETPAESRRLQF